MGRRWNTKETLSLASDRPGYESLEHPDVRTDRFDEQRLGSESEILER
jgi:hypothetical protein